MADHISFSKISDSPLNDFETIYNQTLDPDDQDDSRGISPYDISNINCKYYEHNEFTTLCNQLNATLSYFHINC